MTVLNPIVQTWDGAARRAYLKQGVADFFPIEDLYHEYRTARRTDENLRKFDAFMRAEGNIAKGAGAFTPRYVVLLDGFKMIPYDESLQVNQLGDIITDDPDNDPTLYDISYITGPKPIFIKPSEAETIQLNSDSIVFSSFQGAVWVDVNSIYDDKGTESSPNGNTERPVNNIQLAIEIANDRGFTALQIIGSITLNTGDDVSGFTIKGQNAIRTTITINPGANVANSEIFEAWVIGELDGQVIIRDSVIGDVQLIAGFIYDCAFSSAATISLSNGAVANFLSCYSGTPGLGTPTIDMAGSGTSLGLRAYTGGNGDIVVRGVCHLTDNSNGATVYDHTIDGESIPVNVWNYTQ